MITNNNSYLEAAAETMYELNADEMIQQRCRARRDYYKEVNTNLRNLRELEKVNKMLDEKNKMLDEKDKIIDEKDKEIEILKRQLAEYN